MELHVLEHALPERSHMRFLSGTRFPNRMSLIAPQDYERIVRDWYLQNLKDPDSAKFGRITRPLKEHAITNKFEQQAVYGFSVCAEVNAKNSYGGYTGFKTRWFLIRNGQIVRSDAPKYHIYIGRPYRCIDGPLQG